ncbi:MAG: hypothetical protein U0174_19175 [Polyangiaceae bacterium]
MRVMFVVSVACLSACGSAPAKYPPRARNCEVGLYQGAPSAAIDNIGTVYADCDEALGRKECEAQLKEETCKLGGDVVWDVPEEPSRVGGKMRLSGYAAHTRSPDAEEVPKGKHRKK